ncbi:DUF4388 domain-containing protein [Anaeromyxobacter paludicola]|uniref:GAF domain-containing protein n=1 Tax=Anaeromyxobacter paludicola TaxID=2918171 RepID=A0ABN6N9V0_9BACT|nr:DUF4388 domain-containing protein [Anaeromyxobacter paludicola]BDG09115.1 hypothetical protein AMPC_22280 [Anaeromyxobacter paludicola]
MTSASLELPRPPARPGATEPLPALLERARELAARLEERAARAEELEARLADLESDRTELSAQLSEHEQQVGRLMNLYVATYQLHSTLDPDEVRATVAEIAINLIGAERFVLLFWRQDRAEGCEIALGHGLEEDRSGRYDRGAYAGGDPAVDATLSDGNLRIAPLEGSDAVACVPLSVQGTTVGALVILKLFDHKPMLQPEDRDLLDLIAAHVASAVFAARVYSSTSRKLRTMESLVSEAVGLGRRSRAEATSLSGNLEDVPVADALQFIHLGGRTGTLTVSSGEAEAEISLHKGRIVNAWGPGSKKLGELLRDAGLVDEETLEAALFTQGAEQPRRSLGQILIGMEAVAPEDMYRAVERQIEQTVHQLVTWTRGTFRFDVNEVKPIDEIAIVPGAIVGHLSLDTQMVLLDALRVFDERNRAPAAAAAEPASEAPAAPGPEQPLPAPAPPDAPPEPAPLPEAAPASDVPRLQVVSPDRRLAEVLGERLPEARVAPVNLRDAGTAPPGELPPLVVLDLRRGGVTVEAVTALRRARPRATVLAVVDGGEGVGRAYRAGAMAAVPADPGLLADAARALAQNRRDLLTGGARADQAAATFSKLRRIVGDLRGGLISTTISLSLMSIISESVERAVFFLVRHDGLVALGAFGSSASGAPLAQVTRGVKLAVPAESALGECLADGRVRAVGFDSVRFPESFAALLGRPRTRQCAVFPVIGGQRVIALIYADNGRSNHAIDELEVLELAAAQAGLAFENEMLRRQTAQPIRGNP